MIDNCIDAKESKQSFSPRFTIEIKHIIDRLEKKKKNKKKNMRDNIKDKDENEDDKANPEKDGIVKKPVTLEPSKNATKEREMKKKVQKDIQGKNSTPKKEKDRIEVTGKDDKTIEVTSDEVTSDELDQNDKKMASPHSPEEKPNDDNSVTINSDKNNIQITDKDGNIK